VRLKEGVNKQQFLTQFRNWMPTEMRRGNLFARRIISYDQLLDSTTNSEAMPKLRRGYLSALFFLVNLCLGVIGTFWLQTRSRREEVGVLLSFGGTPGYVIRVLLGEGVLLTLVSSLIGHAGYLTYLHFWGEGFTKSFSLNEVRYLDSSWLDTFSTHALGEAGIITAILLVVVLIGVYIPARAASRVNPVEALRDE
jgi:ABC-type antimicrobial peptide transport system permease subunit